MVHLLDVNALIALAHVSHGDHLKVSTWIARQTTDDRWATFSIVELGFVRVSVQVKLSPDIPAARQTLTTLKKSAPFAVPLLSDELGSESLPAYVTKPAEVTDGHLLALAEHHGAKLTTLDTGIPGAVLIR